MNNIGDRMDKVMFAVIGCKLIGYFLISVGLIVIIARAILMFSDKVAGVRDKITQDVYYIVERPYDMLVYAIVAVGVGAALIYKAKKIAEWMTSG